MEMMEPFVAEKEEIKFYRIIPKQNKKGTGGRQDTACSNGCERVIMKILDRYGSVTIHLLKEILSLSGKHIQPKKHMERLCEKGTVLHYRKEGEDIPCLDVYMAEEGKRQERLKCVPFPEPLSDGTEVLLHLRLLQWHIRVLKDNPMVKEYAYYSYVYGRDERVAVFSLLGIKRGLSLFALAVPVKDTRKKITLMLRQLLAVEENGGAAGMVKNAVPVLLCESMDHMKKTARLMAQIDEFKGMDYFYSIDRITSELNPLTMLYSVRVDMENMDVTMTVYDLTQIV